MHRPATPVRLLLLLSLAMSVSPCGAATEGAPGGPPGWSAAISRVFAEAVPFQAQADIRSFDDKGQELTRVPAQFAARDGSIRITLDVTQISGPKSQPSLAAGLKRMKLDTTVMVIQPAKKRMYVIYPGLKAFAELPVTEETTGGRDTKLEKKVLGQETLDGEACSKTQVVLKDRNGAQTEAIVWFAPKLKNLPVQLQTSDKAQGASVTTRFRDVRPGEQPKADFEPPKGYKRFDDMPLLFQYASSQLLNGGSSPSKAPPAAAPPAKKK